MKHLKLFEAYGKNITYPDYYEWILKLLPEEQLFLIIYSAYQKHKNEVYRNSEFTPAIEIEDETRKENESDENASGSFTIEISTEVGDDGLFASGEASFGGDFSKYYSATHDEPAEGGDFELSSIDVDSVVLYNGLDGSEWEFVYKDGLTTDCFTKEDLSGLLDEYAAYQIIGDDVRKTSYKVSFPQKLKDKIDSLRNPDTVSGYRLLNR